MTCPRRHFSGPSGRTAPCRRAPTCGRGSSPSPPISTATTFVARCGGAAEAPPARVQVVEAHVAGCAPCRDELRQYRALEGLVADVRRAPLPGPDPALARAELEARLADLRRRLVTFGIFSSPLGPILIARSAEGVSMVEYLESRSAAGSRLSHPV